jgi:hypothetical protein
MVATYIGVLGTGTLTRKNAVALIKDAITPYDDVRLMVGAQAFTEAARFAADFATEADGVRLIVYDSGSKVDFVDTDYPEADFKPSDNVVDSLIKACSIVLYAFDEAEPEGQEAEIEQALRAGNTVLDLCGGLFPLELGPDDPGAPVPDEAQQPPVPVAVTPPPLQAVPRPAMEALQEERVQAREALAAVVDSAPYADEVKAAMEAWGVFTAATTPVEQAGALVALSVAMSHLRGVLVTTAA